MEDTLGDAMNNFSVTGYICLNPCSNGRYSRSLIYFHASTLSCLNPCSNGRYSRSFCTLNQILDIGTVLILVLMEDTLGGLGA